MTICDSVKYVGVDDHDIDLFEGQFEVPGGMAYNSYAVVGEKVCVMDSVDANFVDAWLANIESALGSKAPDFLVVQHMEMDHSAGVLAFAKKYPEAKIVSSKMAFVMMKNMFGDDFAARQVVVGEGSVLDLGGRSLSFVAAPNVHWPEVLMAYDEADKILFSADAFGKFGALDFDDPEGWECEARRYYFGIVGKFGAQVQALLKKAAALDIQTICPLHGPVLSEKIGHYVDLYNIWSSYGVETPGIFVAYTSVYGHTKEAAEKLAQILKDKGCPKVAIADLAREDIYECVEDAFRYGKLVLASTTYNGGVFPAMKEFILHLTERNYQKRTVALVENGSWAPAASKAMATLLEPCADIKFAQTKVSIKIAMKDADVAALESLADELLA
ncbi:MAG: FprA family A-type flavoprotein [Treponema sp.]|nr:FprA family A-type flavoprotein [Treponema sp.]